MAGAEHGGVGVVGCPLLVLVKFVVLGRFFFRCRFFGHCKLFSLHGFFGHSKFFRLRSLFRLGGFGILTGINLAFELIRNAIVEIAEHRGAADVGAVGRSIASEPGRVVVVALAKLRPSEDGGAVVVRVNLVKTARTMRSRSVLGRRLGRESVLGCRLGRGSVLGCRLRRGRGLGRRRDEVASRTGDILARNSLEAEIGLVTEHRRARPLLGREVFRRRDVDVGR